MPRKRILSVFVVLTLCYFLAAFFTYYHYFDKYKLKPTREEEYFTGQREWNIAQALDNMKRAEAKEIDAIVSKQQKLKSEKKWDEALQIINDGIYRFPFADKIMTQKGGWYFDKGNWTMAAYYFERAHELNRNESVYIQNIALSLGHLGKDFEAIQWYQKGYDIKPTTSQLSHLFSAYLKFNNWTTYDFASKKILEDVRAEISRKEQKISTNSFVALHLPFTVDEIMKIGAASSLQIKKSAAKPKVPFTHKKREGRLRIGYVSSDLRGHAVGYQVQHMFGMHDKSKFEIFIFNAHADMNPNDPISKNVINGSEHVIHLGNFSKDKSAQLVNNLGIHVLIDMNLFTSNHRMDIFAARAAPVQAAWLGLAVSTGSDFMDYIIADKVVIPKENQHGYSEKIVYLPHSYHIFDHKQYHGILDWQKKENNSMLKGRTVFCNHANSMRNSPEVFDHFANIIKRVPNSVLLMKRFNDHQFQNLVYEAQKRGLYVDMKNETKSQVVFMAGAGGSEHLKQKAMCDLYLDMHLYNGHSTSGDMLWSGVPMVTYPGETMASRAGASFITTMGLPELVVNSWEEYENKAVEIATNPELLARLKKHIADNRLTTPLFDTQLFVREMERAYEMMWDRYEKGLKPDHIYVDSVQTPVPK